MFNLKLALVGAPTSGKTTVMSGLKQMVNPNSPMSVGFIDELASIFLANLPDELKKYDCVALRQIRLFRMQLYIEEKITDIYRTHGSNYLLVTDRGIADAAVYLTNDEIEHYLSTEERVKMYTNYDHILYFDIASEARVLDTISSNSARQEISYTEISRLNELTYDVWSKYPSVDIILQQPTIQAKANLAAKRINEYVGAEVFLIRSETDKISV